MNFNFVEDLFKYYKGNEQEMSNQTNFEELIKSHAEYWKFRMVEKKESGYEMIRSLVHRVLEIPLEQ